MSSRVTNLINDLFRYPQKRILPEEAEGEYWKARRPQGLRELRPWQLDRARLAETVLKESCETISIGDIGAGGGAMLRYLSKCLSVSKAVAYDYDTASLNDAKSESIEAIQIHLWKEEDYARIERADYYLLFEILEHVPRSEVLLTHLRIKAARGICFSVPNTGYMRHRARLVFGKFPLQWIVHPGEHLRFWTIADMRWWLTAQSIPTYRIIPYRGVPILNKLWPNLFAAGIFVFIPAHS